MKIALTALSTLTGLALASGALAQAAQGEVLIPVEDERRIIEPFNITVGEVEDMTVYSAQGEDIGEIEEVLGTSDGTISAVVVEVGGFLGIGEHEAIVPIAMITPSGLRLTIDMTAEEIEALTEWQD